MEMSGVVTLEKSHLLRRLSLTESWIISMYEKIHYNKKKKEKKKDIL